MRKLLFAIFFAAIGLWVRAQQPYFIYLQTEEGQPFYVKLNGEVYSSSSNGFYILPNLVDSTYEIFVGIPGSNSKEAKFTIGIDTKDRGFSILSEENGWALTDLQTGKKQFHAQNRALTGLSYVKREDAFSLLLSKYLGDTSLLYAIEYTKIDSTEIVKDTKPPESVQDVSKQQSNASVDSLQTVAISPVKAVPIPSDTALATQSSKPSSSVRDSLINVAALPDKDTTNKTVIAENTKAEKDSATSEIKEPVVEEFKRSVISRFSESSTSEGFGLVYIDDGGATKDTIRLLIPNPKIIFQKPDTAKQEESFFLERKRDTVQNNEVQIVAASVTDSTSASAKKTYVNNCKAIAKESDFFKLRKTMAAKPTDEAMIAEAEKIFRSKCFTTMQIKNLGALFLTNAGKYQFFAASYSHVSDKEVFSSLQTELTDTYYLGRFKSLIEE